MSFVLTMRLCGPLSATRPRLSTLMSLIQPEGVLLVLKAKFLTKIGLILRDLKVLRFVNFQLCFVFASVH